MHGPQFSAEDFIKFAKEYGFHHKPSSPKFSQPNSEAERAVKTVKTIWNLSSDLSLGLLAYRSTPLENRYSQAQLLMGRNICTTVPIIPKELTVPSPTWPLQAPEEGKRDERETEEELWLPSQGKIFETIGSGSMCVAAWHVHRGKNYHRKSTSLLHNSDTEWHVLTESATRHPNARQQLRRGVRK